MPLLERRKGERRSIGSPGSNQRGNTDRRSRVPRRRHVRYKTKYDVFVDIKNSEVTLGRVIDISWGGLAFHYFDIGRRLKKSFEFDMFVKNNGFHMENVEVKCITDLKADKEYAFSYMSTRRFGGRFNDLSQKHIYQIESLITHHTLERV